MWVLWVGIGSDRFVVGIGFSGFGFLFGYLFECVLL